MREDTLTLTRVRDELFALEQQGVAGDVATHYLEIKKSADGKELVVRGNRHGLVYLARMIVDVAQRDFVGAHVHIDETGIVDHCEMRLVVSRINAPWDR